jgi:UTP pyrophosphatase
MKYLQAYPDNVKHQVKDLLAANGLGVLLLNKYATPHGIRTDRALYDYVMALKNEHLRSSTPLSRVAFDAKLHVVAHALGTHTTISRVQGSQLKSKREIRIATLFKEVPEPFLKMIAVHELAHIKERAHDKAFYKLCEHMQPDYHQLEFDVRLYLTHLEASGAGLWRPKVPVVQVDQGTKASACI